jgi:hypothetical protein
VYLVETVDELDDRWWKTNGEAESAGVEDSADSEATFAVTIMNRYLDHLKANVDDYEDVANREVHVRVSVWRVGAATASSSAPRPEDYPACRYGIALKHSRIGPQAVEIRTPLQISRHIFSGSTD